MMNLDHTVINQIIKDLDKSIEFHNHAIGEEECFKHEVSESNCHHCQLSKIIDDLDCLKSHLEPFNKNTVNSIQFIDVESFCYTLGKQSNIDLISIEPVWETIGDDEPIGYSILAKYSRYTMDGMGSHVGYENIVYKWKAICKEQLGITGIPKLLSNWVVNPDEFEIESKELPPDDIPEHDSDCYININAESDLSDCDCNCADMFEGYYQPDDDFFYSEMNHILEQCNWIEANFNSDRREWTLGYTSFDLNEYQNEPDYFDSCNEENGRPSFGDY